MTVLIGGARSGKSSLAVDIGRRHGGAVVFVATATPGDGDLSARVRRHRADRPGWPTVEEPRLLAEAISGTPGDALVIVDCITMWVSNLLFDGATDEQVDAAAVKAVAAAAARPGPLVAVTNEVGLGVHPETALGMRYRDLLGRVNQRWAAGAQTTLWLVAGRAVPLVDPWSLLA
jgi:adenosyl cobinamide kinase/adenosyl cobinamide phosphate guanylyltransferase